MLKINYRNILAISSLFVVFSTSYAYSAVQCDEYFDLKTGYIKSELPDDIKELGNLLLCDNGKVKLVQSTESIKDLEALNNELQKDNPDKNQIEKLKKSKILEPIFKENKNNSNPNYTILKNIFSAIDSKFKEMKTSSNLKDNESSPISTGNTDYNFYIVLALAILGFLMSAISLFLNSINKKLIENLKTEMKETRLSKKTYTTEMKKFTENINNYLGKHDNSFKRVDENLKDQNSKIFDLEKRVETLSKLKPIELEKTKEDNFNYMEKMLTIKPKTFEEELMEKFHNMNFRDFHEENNGRRVDIANMQDMLNSSSAKPLFKNQEQGKYCVIPQENSSNMFYLFPNKSSDMKIDGTIRDIFMFQRDTENGTYSNWSISQPSEVTLDADSYSIIKKGKIDVTG